MKHQKELFSFLICSVLALFLASTNPSKDEFVDHIKNEYVDSSGNDLEYFFATVTKGIVGLSATTCSRKNYVVFSTYEYAGDIYVGAFGRFFRIK